jgi:hypothetical protein
LGGEFEIINGATTRSVEKKEVREKERRKEERGESYSYSGSMVIGATLS